MSSYTIKLDPIEAPATRRFFEEHGFELRDAPHAFWQARGPGCNATFYQSGKLLLQGKEADVFRGLLGDDTPEARPYWRALQKHPKPAPKAWIGTDEAGKGDYFGPLTVAGVVVTPENLELLATLGVDDSKAVADSKVGELDRAIQGLCPCEVMYISPATYNRLHAKMRTVNAIMAWAHAKVIHTLLERVESPRPDWILVDRFANDRVMTRAIGALQSVAQGRRRPGRRGGLGAGARGLPARARVARQAVRGQAARGRGHAGARGGAEVLGDGRARSARRGGEAALRDDAADRGVMASMAYAIDAIDAIVRMPRRPATLR